MTYQPSWSPVAAQGIIPLHPLTFGQLFGRAFSALRRNPKVLLGAAVTFQIFVSIITILGTFWVMTVLVHRLETVPPGSSDYAEISAGNTLLLLGSGIPLTVISQLLTVFVQALVAAEVSRAVVAEKPSFGQLMARLRPSLGRLALYTLLAAVPGILAVVLGALALSTLAGSLSQGLGLLVAVALLALPAYALMLWLTTKLVAVPSIIVLEGAGVFQAIARSWRLTRTRFWPTLGVMWLQQAIFAVASNIIASILGAIFGIFMSAPSTNGTESLSDVLAYVLSASLPTTIVVTIVSAIGLVVQATTSTIIYTDLRMRHEGLDLDLQQYVERRDAGEPNLPDPYWFDPNRTYAPSPNLYAGSDVYQNSFPPNAGVSPYGAPTPYGAPAPQYGAPSPYAAPPQPYGAPGPYASPAPYGAPSPYTPQQQPYAPPQYAPMPPAPTPGASYPAAPSLPAPPSLPGATPQGEGGTEQDGPREQ